MKHREIIALIEKFDEQVLMPLTLNRTLHVLIQQNIEKLKAEITRICNEDKQDVIHSDR